MAGLLRHVAAALLYLVAAASAAGASTYYASDPNLGSARVVFQTNHGDIEFGFFPHVAPKTAEHIFKLVRLGCYNTNHFFRVDKGFVAQVAAVVGGRKAPMNEEQEQQAEKSIVGEFSTVKHVRGILSMGRYFQCYVLACHQLIWFSTGQHEHVASFCTLIQTVDLLLFLSFLVMLHTLMASMLYLGESPRVTIHCENSSVFQLGGRAFL